MATGFDFRHQEGARDINDLWRAVESTEDRLSRLDAAVEERNAALLASIAAIVQDAAPKHKLTDGHIKWLDLAIQRESQSIEFRAAIIKHTTAAVIVMLIAMTGTAMWVVLREFLSNHGFKI